MNAPVLEDVALAEGSGVIGSEWRVVGWPLGLGLLLLGALFNREVVAAVQTWDVSTAYNHCFLVIPIALYLLWDRRFDLVGIPPRPTPVALLLGLPLALVWLMSERLGIMEGRQLVAVTFVELLFLAVLGKRLWWAMAGPLLYLYFLVPFGEFLTPSLQDITTWFIRHGLEVLGVSAYIDGYIIEIPQGTFFVAEACAGLRFLIASIAFGCVYALVMYRSPARRGLFMLVSVIVPVIANGFRGLGIVYLGYLLGSAEAAAADHIIYGWIFFSIVILLLIALGLPFRQDDISTRSAAPPVSTAGFAVSTRGVLAIALGMVVVAACLTMAPATQGPVPASIGMGAGDIGAGCVVRSVGLVTMPRVKTQRVVCDGVAMDISWARFSPRITAAPLMAQRRRLVARVDTESLRETWLDSSDEVSSAWRIMTSNDPVFVIAVSMWVDGKPIRPGLVMRTKMAINSLFGSKYMPIVVTVTPAVDWDALNGTERAAAAASVPAFLLRHPDLNQAVGALSAQ